MERNVDAVRFSVLARAVAVEARRRGLVVPGFRSPPGIVGARRTIRRRRDGAVIVAVHRAGREVDSVVSDLIEGVVVANRLRGRSAATVRRLLHAAAEQAQTQLAA